MLGPLLLVRELVQERVDDGVVLGHAPDLGCLAVRDVEDIDVPPFGAGAVVGGRLRGSENDDVPVIAEDVVDVDFGW